MTRSPRGWFSRSRRAEKASGRKRRSLNNLLLGNRRSTNRVSLRPEFEQLERRLLLASDFGDAPAPYATLIADNGAFHEATGPVLIPARTQPEEFLKQFTG